MITKNSTINTAAILGALAVAFGAFGAHYLKTKLSPEDLAIYKTAVEYQMYHALALLGVGIIKAVLPQLNLKYTSQLFLAGIIIFSGSLYALTLTKLLGNPVKILGAITPIGGLLFILGWLSILFNPRTQKGQ